MRVVAVLLLAIQVSPAVFAVPAQEGRAPYDVGRYTWRDDGVVLRIVTRRFDVDRHRLGYRASVMFTIDGRAYSGSDGSVPFTEVATVTIGHHGKTLALPRAVTADLFNLSVAGRNALKVHGSRVAIRLIGGNGAGTFVAEVEVDLTTGRIVRRIWEQPQPDVAKVRIFKVVVRRDPET